MSSAWQWLFGKGASSSSSTPTGAIFLRLAKTNVQKISDLISIESQKAYLNPNQCRSLLTKLVKIMQNIESIARFLEMSSCSLSIEASGHFYRISEKAKELVENCCTEDWCQASTFQIQNEEAFKEILLETGLCYSSIFEFAKGVNSNYTFLVEDLRLSSEFEPPSSDEVLEDQIVLLKRYKDFIDDSKSSSSCMRQVYLARHLLRRLEHVHLRNNIEDFDMSTSSLWPDGKSPDDEWGKNSDFLGGNVCKTTWLGVPCAKKVFNDGVGEEEILAEARILAHLNHPNIVKFICCGHDGDNTW
ncbi:hypothetical protein M758_3G210800 [Ceratodon purpureus]|nr:hypothetical protein M758_3G210800 [Ceratodon purpureus]